MRERLIKLLTVRELPYCRMERNKPMVDNQMIPILRQQIKSRDSIEREQAVNSLSKFKDSKVAGVAANIILQVVEDHNQAVRQAARNALTKLGDAGTKALVGMLYCHDWDAGYTAWQTATEILISLGANAVDCLLEVLDSGDDCAKSSGISILAEIGDARAIESLLSKLAKDKAPFADTVKVIAKLKSVSIVEQLNEFTQSEDINLRDKATKALAQNQTTQKSLTPTETDSGEIRINDPNKYDSTLL